MAECTFAHCTMIRLLETDEEYNACVELQRSTWNVGAGELVPADVLRIANQIGGVTAGAFVDDRLCGFVFGMTGIDGDRLVHWSHLLAVRPDAQGRGLGRRLKEFQRARLAEKGVEVIVWTFDPLVARNAHLNLRRLGARVREYVTDMYAGSSSSLHDFGTDRLIVAWETRVDPAHASGSEPPRELTNASIVNPGGAEPRLVRERVLRIEVPDDIYLVRNASRDTAMRWRATTRYAFQALLRDGYTVSTFYREPRTHRCYYIMTAGDVR